MGNNGVLTIPIAASPCPPPLSRLLRCALIVAVLGLAGCASAPEVHTAADLRAQARAAFLAHDYRATLGIVEPQALAGVPWAQYTLGYMYHYGRGLPVDRARARQWIEQAAALEYPPAKEALRRIQRPAPSGDAALAAAAGDTPAAASAAKLPATPAAEAPTAAAAPSTAPIAEPPPPPSAELVQPPAPAVTDEHGLTKGALLPPSAAAADTAVRSNTWIAAQAPARFTLQLIGSGDRDAVLRYIAEHGLAEDGAYYRTERDGQTWYVVTYGNYADRGEAQSALLRLPPALRASSPWIRAFGDIQSQLAGTAE